MLDLSPIHRLLALAMLAAAVLTAASAPAAARRPRSKRSYAAPQFPELRIEPLSSSRARVSWSPTFWKVAGEEGTRAFTLECSVGGGPVESLRYSDGVERFMGLRPGTRIACRLGALLDRAIWVWGPWKHGTTRHAPAAPPLAPPRPGVASLSSFAVKLVWPGAEVDGFILERAVPGGDFAMAARLGPGDRETKQHGLLPGTRYEFRLRAVNAAGVSPPGPALEVRTPTWEPMDDPPAVAECVTRDQALTNICHGRHEVYECDEDERLLAETQIEVAGATLQLAFNPGLCQLFPGSCSFAAYAVSHRCWVFVGRFSGGWHVPIAQPGSLCPMLRFFEALGESARADDSPAERPSPALGEHLVHTYGLENGRWVHLDQAHACPPDTPEERWEFCQLDRRLGLSAEDANEVRRTTPRGD